MVLVFSGSVMQFWLVIALTVLIFVVLGCVLAGFFLVRKLMLLIWEYQVLERMRNEMMFAAIDRFLRGKR